MSDITKKIKEKLDKDYVEFLMDELGAKAQNGRFQTVCHGGDGYNLAWYPDTGRFCCFSCCGNMDIFDVVMKAKGCTFPEAQQYLAEKLGIPLPSRKRYSITSDSPVVDVPIEEKFVEPEIDYSLPEVEMPGCYYSSAEGYDEWNEEGISYETMEKYGIRYNTIRGWVLIPCYDINQKLVGVRRREVPHYSNGVYGEWIDEITNKYMPITNEFESSKMLFGIWHNKDIIKQKKTCVIFEGEKSVMKSDSIYGNRACVACYGHYVSPAQVAMLKDLGVETVILAFDYDNDDSVKIIRTRANQILRCGMKKVEYLWDGYSEMLGAHDSPIDKGRETYEELMRRRQPYLPE